MQPNAAFVFSTNFSDPLLLDSNPFPDAVKAVLLSERYATPSALEKIAAAKNRGCLIISDNGNFTRMSAIAKQFSARGASMLVQAKEAIANCGKIGDALLQERQSLMSEIRQICTAELQTTGFEKIIAKQLLCRPDYLIALEDYTVTVLTMASVLHPIYKPRARDVEPHQRHTAKLYKLQKRGSFGHAGALAGTRNYIVLHSYDYSSAKQGAKLYKATVQEGVSISFGGPLASKDYIRRIKLRRKFQYFDTLLPEPYLLAAAIVIGVQDGLADKETPIHILGLGSPIVIILLGYLLRKSKEVSIDATSSFKDASDGTIYGSREAYLKMDMYKVAAFALIKKESYTSSSPFFQEFETKFPANWTALRQKLHVKSTSGVSDVAALLRANPELLEKYIPYFTPMRSGNDQLIKAVRMARAGSNYFVLESICNEIRQRKGDQQQLKAWVFQQLDRYNASAGKKWGEAMGAIVRIIEKYGI